MVLPLRFPFMLLMLPFRLPLMLDILDMFEFMFDMLEFIIGVEVAAGVVYAVFVFVPVMFMLEFVRLAFALAFPAVSLPHPVSPMAPAQIAASIDPFSLLISFS